VQVRRVCKHCFKTIVIRSISHNNEWSFLGARSIHVKNTTTWFLHKFPCNAHSHVQHT
jgi:hypothetical protein